MSEHNIIHQHFYCIMYTQGWHTRLENTAWAVSAEVNVEVYKLLCTILLLGRFHFYMKCAIC